jgi:N-acetylglucosamine kinase-like BadF-type ATPase
MPTFVMGVDGGTTKTIALVADDQGRILGASRGEGSNWTGSDVGIPMAVVSATAQAALRQAGLCGDDIAMAVFGLAGADWPEDHERRQTVLERGGLARRLVVKNDAFVGLRAGTQQRYGVAIAAGTGTNTAVITPDGTEWAFGYYAAEGGAGDIARDAIRAVLHAEDGRGQPTALTGAILGKLNYPNVDDLLRALIAEQVEWGKILSLCPLVFEAADASDAVAAEIIIRHGLTLAEYATAVVRRFAMQSLEFDVVLSGSVFKGQGPLLIDTITQAIQAVAPRARIVRVQFEPAVGGLLLAYDALGIHVSDEMYHNLAQTTPGAAFFSTADGGQMRKRLRRK